MQSDSEERLHYEPSFIEQHRHIREHKIVPVIRLPPNILITPNPRPNNQNPLRPIDIQHNPPIIPNPKIRKLIFPNKIAL
jgi:hypothetical protein